jgi:hypothetical protein
MIGRSRICGGWFASADGGTPRHAEIKNAVTAAISGDSAVRTPKAGISSPQRGTGGLEEKTRITKTRDAKPQKERGSVVSPQIPEERAKGLEPSTSSLGSGGVGVYDAGKPVVLAGGFGRCTGGCTENADTAEAIARAVELVASLELPHEDSVAVLRHLLQRQGPTRPKVTRGGKRRLP